MKKHLLAAVSALASLALTACFQNETTIHLKKDGSGKIVEETILGTQMLEMLEQMAAMGGEEAEAKDPLKEMFSEEKATKRAAELGKGVTFDKLEFIDADGRKGARVTYLFKDINQVAISSGDSMKNMSPQGAPPPKEENKVDPIKFKYTDGELVIKFPVIEKEAADAPPAPDAPEENAQMEAMMKEMMADMKIGIKLVAEPGISKTNASHRQGNTITLMEMDMGKLVKNEAAFKKLSTMGKKDPAEAMKIFKDIDGVKFEDQPEVRVTLK